MTNKKSWLFTIAAALLLLLALMPVLPVLGQAGGGESSESSGVERYLDGTQDNTDGGSVPSASETLAELQQVLGADKPTEEDRAADETSQSEEQPKRVARNLLRCDFYDEPSFLSSVSQAASYPVEGELTAGIVPHHLLAAPMIASFFKTAAQSGPYDTVVIVATMHYTGKGEVVTVDRGYTTPFGTAELDTQLTERLLADPVLAPVVDNEVVQQDHAVSGLIPYIKYYLPEANIALCQIANTADARRQQALSDLLQNYTQENRCLVVGSLDFSHHLTPDEAALRDVQTARALEAFDYTAIASLGDENLDSPYTACTILQLAEAQSGTLVQLDHGSAEQFLQLPLSHQLYEDGATTYFIYGITRPDELKKAK